MVARCFCECVNLCVWELLLPAGKVQRLTSHYFVMCALTNDASMGNIHSIVAVLFWPEP